MAWSPMASFLAKISNIFFTVWRFSCSLKALRVAFLSLQKSISGRGPFPTGVFFSCVSTQFDICLVHSRQALSIWCTRSLFLASSLMLSLFIASSGTSSWISPSICWIVLLMWVANFCMLMRNSSLRRECCCDSSTCLGVSSCSSSCCCARYSVENELSANCCWAACVSPFLWLLNDSNGMYTYKGKTTFINL